MLSVTLLTPERTLFEGEASLLVAPAPDGEVGIQPRHAPFLCALGVGRIKIAAGDGDRIYAVRGGFLEVLRDRVTVLAGSAVAPREVQPAALEAEVAELRAEKGIRTPEAEEERRARLAWAKARLRVGRAVNPARPDPAAGG